LNPRYFLFILLAKDKGDVLLTRRSILAALATWPLAAQTLSFTPQTVSAGNSPISVRLHDFDRDNKLDIVVINGDGSETVSVLLNLGGGNFSAPITSATGGFGSMALTAADFNHDGKEDLAVVNNLTNNVSILLGNGDGTFSLGSLAGVHEGPVSVAEADFNGDGNVDLAVVNSLTGDVTILLGKADGTFRPGTNVFVGSSPTGIKSGDFNGDGFPDFAVANGTLGQELVYIFLGNGDGTFRSGGKVHVGIEPFALVAEDFNHDGTIDLGVANLGANTVSVLLGNGNGTFKPATNYPAGNGPVSIRVGSFSQSGNADLALCADVSAEVLVFLGNGDGTFQTPQPFSTGDFCNSLAVGDLEQTGRSDVVAATTDNLVVLINNGPG
jgi:hypothetical protein